MLKYNHTKVEAKWQKIWEKKKLYKTDLDKTKNKFYCLVMFPYPSSDKLHIGHWYNFGPVDTYARYQKMLGKNVFEPIGFDAFGLPAENYAIKGGVLPKKSTIENINYIRKQLKQIGAMYDWSKEIITSDPEYYKWTQWLFLQLYKNGLAYRKKAKVNFCPSCQTVLANEQVINGLCERCDSEVIQKDLEQWFFKITEYADKLISGLDNLSWSEESKKRQKDWIGRSEGTIIKFKIDNLKLTIPVFTTRADTLFGATYIVLAPEKWQELNSKSQSKIQNYLDQTKKKTVLQRQLNKEKTGIFTRLYALNPINNEKIPVWIADYVLPDYGTGAVMCVPAHDSRDFEFAKKYKLPIKQVIVNRGLRIENSKKAFEEDGKLENSAEFSGFTSEKARQKITEKLKNMDVGDFAISYKLKDWLVSRQRYWGSPIPIIYCEKCGEVLVPEKDLPIKLPTNVDFRPHGESPLARSKEFVNVSCPKCSAKAKRETDTMDTFVCSSWYFLRYLSPKLNSGPFDHKIVNSWLPVDLYVGGKEHVNMHLLYARFVTKVLHNLKYLNFDEPFTKLIHQGVITKDSAKMSKSRGNVVIPDEFIQKYGADVLRLYLMSMGPYNEGGDWSDKGIVGMERFINKIWNFANPKSKIQMSSENINTKKQLHRTIKKVTDDLEGFKFNTAIAALIEWLNFASNKKGVVARQMLETYLILLAPFTPHFAEELWSQFGHKQSIFFEKWPTYNQNLIKEEVITIVVQINGKVRDQITVKPTDCEKEIIKLAQNTAKIKKWLAGKKIKKTIFVENRLINFVI